MKAREELYSLLWQQGILRVSACSPEENKALKERMERGEPLPDDIYQIEKSGEFVRLDPEQLAPEEQQLLVALKQLRALESLKWLAALLLAALIGLILLAVFGAFR